MLVHPHAHACSYEAQGNDGKDFDITTERPSTANGDEQTEAQLLCHEDHTSEVRTPLLTEVLK